MLWRMAIKITCGSKVILMDFVYKEIVDINPDGESPNLYQTLEDNGWKGWNYRGVEIVPEIMASLRIDSFLLHLSTKLASIRLQLETRLTKVSLKSSYPTPAPEIASMLRHGLGYSRRKLNCEDGAFKRKELEPVLEEFYPQIQLDITAKSQGKGGVNVTFSSKSALETILQSFYSDSRETRVMLKCIFSTFRNCFDVAKRAPTVLRSLSGEQDLLAMFSDPPDTCTYESFAKLQTVSRLLEIKGVY
jgi:hypothetical protein